MYPGNDPKYANIPEAAKIRTESLKVIACCFARVRQCVRVAV